jgi:hypothetical protein
MFVVNVFQNHLTDYAGVINMSLQDMCLNHLTDYAEDPSTASLSDIRIILQTMQRIRVPRRCRIFESSYRMHLD